MIRSLLALLVALQTSNLPPAFPRDGAKQLIDNDRVTVWDVVIPKGKPTVMHQHKYDMVRVELADTTVRVTNPGGSPGAPGNIRMGTVAFGAKGMAESQETTGNTPRHAIMIELKDVVVPPIRNTSGYPDAFPRDGAKKVPLGRVGLNYRRGHSSDRSR